uniref:DUF3558 family protein n=1 Tax=Gordonia sp. B7-2 TaxID=3420932 RepID=UPI003D91BD80
MSDGSTTTNSLSRPSIRQVDDAGRRLPFMTVFPNRWSSNNDGTQYEPCTSVSDRVLASLGLDPRSVSDAAVADHQTVRGCEWDVLNRRRASASQYVGNLAGSGASDLDGYKAIFDDFRWFPDRMIDGRTVAVFSLGVDHCATITVSGRALVFTDAALDRDDKDVSENCNFALAFTRATINKIPR